MIKRLAIVGATSKKVAAALALAGLVALGASACGGVNTAGLQQAGALYFGCTVTNHGNTVIGLKIANPTGKPVTVTGITVDILAGSQVTQQETLSVDGNSVQPGTTSQSYPLDELLGGRTSCRVASWS